MKIEFGKQRFGVIGYGAIAEEIVRALKALGEPDRLAAVLGRTERVAEARDKAAGRFAIVDRIEALLEIATDMVCECAGQDALREFGAAVLSNRTDLVCASVGALAQPELTQRLESAARDRARILIPSGAVQASTGCSRREPQGCGRSPTPRSSRRCRGKAHPGERLLRGAALDQRTTLFEGTAREAALLYAQNANVGATVAFAGVGLDRTKVALVSDPDVSGPLGIIEAEGDFGTFRFEILAYASRSNPKTSALTAHSMLAALSAGVAFALPRQ